MRMGRVLRGAAALSLYALGSHGAFAGTVDDRFPFLPIADGYRSPEAKADTVTTASRVPAVSTASAAHRRAPVPYPRPAPGRDRKAASTVDFTKPTPVEPQMVRTMAADAAPSELTAQQAETAHAVALSGTAAPSNNVIAVASAITVNGDVAVPVSSPSDVPATKVTADGDNAPRNGETLRASIDPKSGVSAFADPKVQTVAYAADPSSYPSPSVSAARGLSVSGKVEAPAQTVAARMAPLGGAYQTASLSQEDPPPETGDAAQASDGAHDVGGPFVPMPKRRTAKLTSDDIVLLVENTAVAHGVPLELAHAVVRVESNYNPNLTGRGGTLGLMQIKYATARGIGYSGTAKALMEPAVNLEWGMRYLAGARKLAKGSVCGTILRYQAGHRAVRMTHAAAQYCGRVRHIMAAIH